MQNVGEKGFKHEFTKYKVESSDGYLTAIIKELFGFLRVVLK